MNKTDLLLQMMEQPHRYTADEWQEILADDECRELYTLMSKTQSAVDAVRVDAEVTHEMIDAEWQRLARPHSQFSILNSQFRKVAAMFVGILMLSGIAFAAIHIWNLTPHTSPKGEGNGYIQTSDTIKPSAPLPTEGQGEASPKCYDNVPLGEIFDELSTYYHIGVAYRNDATRQIRLFYQWKPEYTIEKVVDMLNNFEWLQLKIERDTVFVSSTVEPQP